MAKENRKYKDTVFADLFYSCEDAKKNLTELYNALFDEHLTDPEKISLERLENTLFMGLNNDVSFSVENRRIVLAEHQSTINKNMPLRNLLYIAGEYEKLIPTEARYKKEIVGIPTPTFITFYNGEEDYPTEETLRLSDSYKDKDEKPMLELTVRVININPNKSHEILRKCRTLNEYSRFVEEVRHYKGDKDALEKAIKECIRKGILKEYLSKRGSEVTNMLIAEYDYETDMRVQYEEALEKGIAKGKTEEKSEVACNMLAEGCTVELISKVTGLTVEEIEKLKVH